MKRTSLIGKGIAGLMTLVTLVLFQGCAQDSQKKENPYQNPAYYGRDDDPRNIFK
jgi:hypothetical protein